MRILISVGDKNAANPLICSNYRNWIGNYCPDAEIIVVDASDLSRIEILMKDVGGVLLTGGCDINPALYHRPQDSKTVNVNEERDALELAILAPVFSQKIPLLGVCRGFQIVNIFLGGSLHQDIESLGLPSHKRDMDAGIDAKHVIQIERSSKLAAILGATDLTVNSSHHQSVDAVGKSLAVAAHAGDGTIEALEGTDPLHWVMLVQWHPERMKDMKWSAKILGAFKAAMLS